MFTNIWRFTRRRSSRKTKKIFSFDRQRKEQLEKNFLNSLINKFLFLGWILWTRNQRKYRINLTWRFSTMRTTWIDRLIQKNSMKCSFICLFIFLILPIDDEKTIEKTENHSMMMMVKNCSYFYSSCSVNDKFVLLNVDIRNVVSFFFSTIKSKFFS